MVRAAAENRHDTSPATNSPRTKISRVARRSFHPVISDPVPWDCPGAQEIDFELPELYNASEVLFKNLKNGCGDRLAVTGPSGERTYRKLCHDAAQWGNALLSLGLMRGDRVVLLLDDTAVYPAVFFGAVRAGLVPVLVNPLTPPNELQFYLADSNAAAAVAEAGFSARFNAIACAGTRLNKLIAVNGEPRGDLAVEAKAASSWLPFFSIRLQPAQTHRNEMAFWMYSSGSTGRPKGIVHLQHDMPYTAASYARHVLKLTSQDLCFSVPKIFFSYGFSNSITYPFSAGAASILMPGAPKPEAVFATIAKYRPTVFFGLPTLYTNLLKEPDVAGVDFSSLRLAISAAEILSSDIFQGWKQLTGLEIVEGLGSTEVQNIYLSNTVEKKKPGSAGMRVPGYELVLKDKKGNTIEGPGEGILWVRGHSSTPFYWNCPAKTAETIREGGWLCTKDRFARDADGFHYFRGRGDDLVRVSGQWVHPVEVQSCLLEHPAVRECAVLPVELPDLRMTLKAFVVLKHPPANTQKAARELQDYVKSRLLPYKYPRIISFLPELPKMASGKVDRQALLTLR